MASDLNKRPILGWSLGGAHDEHSVIAPECCVQLSYVRLVVPETPKEHGIDAGNDDAGEVAVRKP